MRRLLTSAAGAALLMAAAPARADTVADWWDYAGKIASPLAATTQTPDQQRAITRASLAMFEAVNAIDRRYESWLNFPAADPAASQDAAAATAAFKVLAAAFPAMKTTLEESYAITMDELPDGPAKDKGRAIGEAAAMAALAVGGLDPAVKLVPYRPRTAPGEWVPTALPAIDNSMYAMKPWAIPSVVSLMPPPPVALGSERWAKDYEEVRRLGGRGSKERTPHQTLMARYRQALDLTPTMRSLADQPGRTPVQNARMFARYQMAFDDAAEVMAAAKFKYDFWRPITAIRNGAADGNEATQPDPAWVPLLPTPNFAEYPCGHCTVAAAIAEIMKTETGPRPPGGVRVGSLAVPNSIVQTLPDWDTWAQQVSDSRTYGGVHFRFSNEAGEQIGRTAARIVAEKVARPLAVQKARRGK
ncbi:MAG: vanadium-dependent haloperoxidase [Alphaproteobacteria bacterium]|nr:vanadium-dependent haloperoxidase [Alphaproteobacteria bacterium]